MLLDIKNFFNLENFEHKKIFQNIEHIWQALANLDWYFKEKNLNKIKSFVPSGCFIESPELVFIGENTKIEPNTFIKGPCIIGNNCEVRHGAYLRGRVLTGDRCVIGHCSEVKNSIFLNDAKAAHFAYVGDAILGNRVNLGAGVKCANFKLNGKNICFFIEGIKFCTDLVKLGAIIGDNSQIGCNSVLNPATFLEKNVICYANINVGGWIKDGSIIKNNKENLIKHKNEIKVSGKK